MPPTNAVGGPFPSRYCYVKLVPPEPNVNEVYHTYFWTMDGKRLPFETVVQYRNFHVQPFVEIEDIFVSKAVRSLQLKLRECLVIPPVERPAQRFSVVFPEQLCTREEEEHRPAERDEIPEAAPEPDAIPPPAKRPCLALAAALAVADEEPVEAEEP